MTGFLAGRALVPPGTRKSPATIPNTKRLHLFSFVRYNLLNPANTGFAKFENYQFLWGDASFSPAIINTVIFIAAIPCSRATRF
jgi:hypothetical protein